MSEEIEKTVDDNNLTPMMVQYREIKTDHPDEILFFRLGDFYEMFFDDAKLVAGKLGLTLTRRNGDKDCTPMCGIPYHAAENYIAKIIKLGYKVAIAEQIGDPKARGLTKREVIKVITPGTVCSESVLDMAVGTQNNYIALLAELDEKIFLVAADASTGEFFYADYDAKGGVDSLFDEIYRLAVAEIIIATPLSFADNLKNFLEKRLPRTVFTRRKLIEETAAKELITRHFAETERPQKTAAIVAAATLLDYLHSTLMTDLSHINHLVYLNAAAHLVVGIDTLRNLEITKNLRDGSTRHTLYDILNFTGTAMGARQLKKWLEEPLLKKAAIDERLDSVAVFAEDFRRLTALQEKLKEIYDFERIVTRIELNSANARDLVALKASFLALPPLKAALAPEAGRVTPLLGSLRDEIRDFSKLAELIDRAIVDEPNLSLKNGDIIKAGYNEELDSYRRLARDSKAMLQEIEERERQATGIKTLKIGYNKVFGYYIEIRNTSRDLVPDRYIRKQTLVSSKRYITEELKNFETRILGAQEKIASLEYNLFEGVRDTVKEHLAAIQKTARAVGTLDAIVSFASAATEYNYVRPQITDDGAINITDGRHPLVERLLTRELFVPNDAALNHESREIIIITGPNMAGKSTYMRQVAIITLMAQAGSFVPAKAASITPVDRIFTRIGASDDLSSGQSTFMVEMSEVSQILKFATKNSLVILDEIGRGTSTFDGMSIARACLEHIRDHIHAKTLFATHYHELTDLADVEQGGKTVNCCIAVKERGDRVDFLRRIISGSADKSYGIHVARLAGLPKSVTTRAKTILAELESAALAAKQLDAQNIIAKNESEPETETQASLFSDALRDEILALDVMTLTPIEALNVLYRLQNEAKNS